MDLMRTAVRNSQG